MEIIIWFTGSVPPEGEELLDQKDYTAHCMIKSDFFDEKLRLSYDIEDDKLDGFKHVVMEQVSKAFDMEIEAFRKG